ncbi:PKD domain-containing protein [Methanosarcina sp. KYL-1]|uniref:PKD domain-containing protein n=1 Tax=Methanosarcina sp. KYL-1 TaxID=2602068 RepID=UPI002101CB47|nr:PKD domain-containing protein [Methanosarcina sp. KYL-1]
MGSSFKKSENAAAIALAGIILFAIAFTVYTAVQVQYVPEWKTDAEYAHMNEVWGDMGMVKSSVDTLAVLMDSDSSAAEAGTSISIPISMGGGALPVVGTLKSGGTLAVNEDHCSVEIDFFDENIQDEECDCGTVAFLSDNHYYIDQAFCYENGALIFEQDGLCSMKLTPSFINFQIKNNESEIYLNPVEIRGDANSLSGNTRGGIKLSTKSFTKTQSTTSEGFRLTITTEYPTAWENYLDSTARGAGLTYGDEYEISRTSNSVIFAYLNLDNSNVTVHCRNAVVEAEVVVGDEGNSAWEYDEEDLILPIADFTANRTSGTSPLTVRFTDQSENTASRDWDFGDGNTSFSRNPVHTFTSPGDYTVELTARNENGTDTKSLRIEVSGIPKIYPVANFTAKPTNGPIPLIVQFNDTSTGNPTSWLWEFGDGSTSNTKNPMHAYSVGNFPVRLTVTNANGTDTEIKENYINAGILLTEKWYTYNNVSISGDSTIDVEALKDYNSSIESYFVPGGAEINELIEGYVPVNNTNSAYIDKEGDLELNFDFVNFYETGSNISSATIVIVYAYDRADDTGKNNPMPEIVIKLQNEVLTTIRQNTLVDSKWYVFRDTLSFDTPPTASEITSQLKIDINGEAKEGVFLIDYIGVYLS